MASGSNTEIADDEGTVVAEYQGGGFAVAAAEVDQQIATAHRFPRNLKAFKKRAFDLATLDEETAASCFYSLPRDGKTITGPSARLAEIVVSSWGNIRAETRVVDITDKEVISEALCWDLEMNVAIRVQVRRRITKRDGKRFSDDMIVVTGNAASSIALRNAVFKVIPAAVTKSVYQAARQVAIGDAKSLSTRRHAMVDHFAKMGVSAERICAAVNKPSLEDIGLEELATLIGLSTAIKEGDTTIDDAFPDPNKPKDSAKPKMTTPDELTGKGKQAETKPPEGETKPTGGELATPDQIDAIEQYVADHGKTWATVAKKLGVGKVDDMTVVQASAAITEMKKILGK